MSTYLEQAADLSTLGLNPVEIRRNWSTARLYEAALHAGSAQLMQSGSLVVATGRFTGRSPRDRFIVDDELTHDRVDWGDVNQPIAPSVFDALYRRVAHYLSKRVVYVQDVAAGADPAYRLPVRVITEHAWASLFARNLLIDADATLSPLTIVQAPGFTADPARDGTRSETFILLDLTRRLVLIGGTHYTGEIKKAVFSALNFFLPSADVLPMHCSINRDRERAKTAVFFGLSGTGKTTLSTDPDRVLIGDDEHGWSPNGVFNFEGGCYAKVIDISEHGEPEIFAAAHRFGTVLENVILDADSRRPDFKDRRHTENTRAAYPLHFIASAASDGMGPHPSHIIMLTADAFGVLPPVARLSPEQAIYHFLSGYTAKVAGTEAGVAEPRATFSACFGEPFMILPPPRYAEMLSKRITAHRPHLWLVNTGWTAGPYGTGHRMPLAATRAIVRAVLAGRLNEVPVRRDPRFGLDVPESCPGVEPALLQPRTTWADPDAYDDMAAELARRFAENFTRYANAVPDAVSQAGPH